MRYLFVCISLVVVFYAALGVGCAQESGQRYAQESWSVKAAVQRTEQLSVQQTEQVAVQRPEQLVAHRTEQLAANRTEQLLVPQHEPEAAQTKAMPATIKFETESFDFSKIKEVDGEVSCVFKFTNIGAEPFVVESVTVACGCTEAEFTRSPIMPGGQGQIAVTFNPAGRPGAFSKFLTVMSDNRHNVTMLEVRGFVQERPRTPEDDYPVMIGSGLRVEASDVAMGQLPRGGTKSVAVGCYNSSDSPIRLAVGYKTAAGYLNVSFSATTLKPRERGVITLTYDLRGGEVWGRLENKFDILVDGQRRGVEFLASGIAVDDFSKLSTAELVRAPVCSIERLYLNLGAISAGKQYSCKFTITNTGQTPLEIRNIKCGEGLSTDVVVGKVIEPYKSLEMTALYRVEMGAKGNMSGNIALITNDPVNPLQELRVAAKVAQ